ncbi:uncharacterized protein LOC129740503 [Uranotaenia lowii]|uniref:uncharacterized protein LOC129740503 n=1 Tax=Uranotaenia lowii TaxID=190385 RepID=UPI002479279D|nr:uncharacterized protein LOC129740503 [Uranotaenia lowii]
MIIRGFGTRDNNVVIPITAVKHSVRETSADAANCGRRSSSSSDNCSPVVPWLPFLSQVHQQQVQMAVVQAKQIAKREEVNAPIWVANSRKHPGDGSILDWKPHGTQNRSRSEGL